jgi:hypothetical protein
MVECGDGGGLGTAQAQMGGKAYNHASQNLCVPLRETRDGSGCLISKLSESVFDKIINIDIHIRIHF